jgi:chromate transporter
MSRPADHAGPAELITRRALFGIFLKAGLAFGGGLGILAVLEQELVTRRQAVDREEFLRLYGLGRVVPSGTMTALAVAYGYRFAGLVGALATTAAILLPGYLMLPLLWGYERVKAVRLVPSFTRGLTVASVGLIFAAALSIGRATLTGWVSLVVFAAALAMAQLLQWNPLLVLGVSAVLGISARALGWA